MRLEGLNENHERGLLASAQYAAKLIRDCEEVLAATEHPRPFSRYAGSVTPPQRRILGEYLRRLDAQLARVLEGLGLTPPEASVDALWAVNTALAFLDTTFEEMRGRYLRGYGEVSPEADRVLDGLVSETQALVREVGAFVSGAPSEVLRGRADRLPHDHPLRTDVQTLARIITDHGLVDLRPALGLLLDRAMETTFEVAVVGRVSSGKSTLLNALIGSSLLPTGVLPVTAFPTRVRRGSTPRVQIVRADGHVEIAPVERLDEFVTEAKNPGNEKRLARLLVEYPSERLPEGVTFVDTPGLGSVASTGALQTFAYLPRCDHATFLFEATSPVTDEDISVLAFLQESGITTSLLLSKADLLNPGDLEQVRAYVADQLRRRVGRTVPIRPISTIPGHERTLETWIAGEVAPLEGRARAEALVALRRRLEVLRRQAAGALARQLRGHKSTGAIEERPGSANHLRDEAAALEREHRDLLALTDHRASLVTAAFDRARTALAQQSSDLNDPDRLLRAAFARPAQELAETVAGRLMDRATAVHGVVAATGIGDDWASPDINPTRIGRDIPLLDLPPLTADLNPPWWARPSVGLTIHWQMERLHAGYDDVVTAAVAAYLDVLKRWAGDRLARLRREFESVSRPLTRESAGPAPVNDSAIRPDLAWLTGRSSVASIEENARVVATRTE